MISSKNNYCYCYTVSKTTIFRKYMYIAPTLNIYETAMPYMSWNWKIYYKSTKYISGNTCTPFTKGRKKDMGKKFKEQYNIEGEKKEFIYL